MDQDLRVSLWSVFYLSFVKKEQFQSMPSKGYGHLLRSVWFLFLKKPIDEFEANSRSLVDTIKTGFIEWEWFCVFDFLEFVVKINSYEEVIDEFMSTCNRHLEREVSAYRFVDKQIVEITSEEEIKEIEQVINVDDKFHGVRQHTKTALSLMSDRKTPDYRNSIKESISAVESLCKIISRDPKATLNKALDSIEKTGSIKFHPAQKKGYQNLYGYTSDAEGIRHALMYKETLSFEDAKYMLVVCSAFVNYLISKTNL